MTASSAPTTMIFMTGKAAARGAAVASPRIQEPGQWPSSKTTESRARHRRPGGAGGATRGRLARRAADGGDDRRRRGVRRRRQLAARADGGEGGAACAARRRRTAMPAVALPPGWRRPRADPSRAPRRRLGRVAVPPGPRRGDVRRRAPVPRRQPRAGGRVGFHVVTPLALADGRVVLVDRGWVAAGATRDTLPDGAAGRGPVVVTGRVALPTSGYVELGPTTAPEPSARTSTRRASPPRRACRCCPIVIEATAPAAAEDAALVRDWPPPDAGGDKHRIYMMQWYAFAALAAGCGCSSSRAAGALSLRRPRRSGAPSPSPMPPPSLPTPSHRRCPPAADPDCRGRRARARSRSRRTLILLALVTIAPVVASYTAYYLFPRTAQTNYGTLLPVGPAQEFRATTTPARAVDVRHRGPEGPLDAADRGARGLRRELPADAARDAAGGDDAGARAGSRRARCGSRPAPAPSRRGSPPSTPASWSRPRRRACSTAGPGAGPACTSSTRWATGCCITVWIPDIKGLAKDLTRVLKASRIG